MCFNLIQIRRWPRWDVGAHNPPDLFHAATVAHVDEEWMALTVWLAVSWGLTRVRLTEQVEQIGSDDGFSHHRCPCKGD